MSPRTQQKGADVAEVSWDPPGPGPWIQDRAHLPVSCTALLGEIYPDGMYKGFAETCEPWGVLIDGVYLAYVNGFPYIQLRPFDAPGPDGSPPADQIEAEFGRRLGVAAAAFENRVWRDVMDSWDNEIKPAAIAEHQRLADVDLASLDDEGLRLHLHQCIEHLGAMWYQHHRFNLMAMIPPADFLLQAAAWTGRPPIPMAAVLDGFSPVSGVIPPELEAPVAALKADPGLAELLSGDAPAEERMAELRSRVPVVDEYMRTAGYRLAAGFDLTNPTIGERPDVVLDRLRNALDHEDTTLQRAEALAVELRADVPPDNQAEFDDLLAEARFVYRLRDERGLYSDSAAVGLLRLALIELGRRLFERGRINFMYDTLDVTSADIDALLDGADSPTADELSARVALRKQLSADGAPPLLGPPPPPPPPVDELPPPLRRVMSALGFYMDGILGGLESPVGDAEVIVGIGGSGGSAEGPAHIIRNFDDLMELEEGDILITTATGESFNAFLHLVAAVVTDHGSFASHAAIMGREMGFPSVVGTNNATSRVPQGARVRVDGDSGTITILDP